MKALDQSAVLIRRGEMLRARSVQARTAAHRRMENSRHWPRRPPRAAGSVATVDPGCGDSTWLDPERIAALRQESRALRQSLAEARARARATRDQASGGRSQREILHDSAYARLQARMGTMPVIEQAKGIIMAQRRCASDEAFDLLRQASQRSNVKLHVLAEQIVKQIASSTSASNVTPIPLGTTGSRPSRTRQDK